MKTSEAFVDSEVNSNLVFGIKVLFEGALLIGEVTAIHIPQSTSRFDDAPNWDIVVSNELQPHQVLVPFDLADFKPILTKYQVLPFLGD